MKKTTFIFPILFLIFSAPAFSQVDLGVQISPSLSFNRLRDESPTEDFSASGVGGRLVAGLIADYNFQENYYASTGLFFVPKRVGIEGGNGKEAYRLHYLQIPVSIKLFTNEVALDTRIYFQAGLTADIKLLEDNISDQVTYVTQFRGLDSSLLIAAGAEYRFGYSTILFGGISYRRGLGNVVKNTIPGVESKDLIIKNDLLGIDIGVKF